MKINEPEQKPMTDAELDAALAQMAEEAPPMPADFHDRWMNAVRADAKETKHESAEQTASEHIVSITRWTRILSVAAVFVFLIGGTLLYRSTKKSLNHSPMAADIRENAVLAVNATGAPAAEPPAESAAGEAEQIPEEEVPAVSNLTEAPSAAEDVAYIEEADYAVDAEAAYEAEEEAAYAPEAGGAYESYAMKAAGPASNSYAAGEAAEAAVFDAAAPAPTSVPTALPTEAPTPEPTETPKPAPAPTEEPEAEPAGFLPALGSFFTDMGDFLLAALPYLLVLAVPALAALVIRRKKNPKA